MKAILTHSDLHGYGLVGVDPARILLTNGSDELCYLIATVFLSPGKTAVVGDPCYQIDATASLPAGAALRRVPLHDGRHDIGAMAEAADGTAVVWLPSPHNPTGAAARPGDLEALLSQVPEDCLVVLDEAYRAFADPDSRPDVAALLDIHPNLLVQRTLSKDWALAGLRAGYGLGAPELMTALRRVRPPFSVNAMALAAVEAAAGAPAWRAMAVARAREERAKLEAELARLGVEYVPSQANFVTARLDPARVAPALAGSGLGPDYGLAAGGEAGVRHAIELLASELRRTMQLCGVTSVPALRAADVVPHIRATESTRQGRQP